MVQTAVLGYGTVGSGVVKVIDTNHDSILAKAGVDLQVKYILDLREFPGDPNAQKVVHDVEVILQDPEAVSYTHLELLGHNFFVFCNAENEEVNVVYKRKGNTYGLIEPEE